ncbi:3'-5' exonuclease [Paenibacillus thermotolerans]|uniref:3'-5' exonuclease n=1 Tax=Paenibacillus thermotolerans TaxID=3027807 RepID=UPI0023679633|nr:MULTISPECIES: 3'-5' exonuclease [unclassified Paenibacillus]
MNAVVFDLELVKRFKKGQLSEIVEIGACKVDLLERKIIDHIQIYICPKRGYISKSTRKFINMAEEDLDKAVPFEEGIERFKDWLGEDYYLCSWGKDDKVHLVNECVRNHLKLDWIKNYNDIQHSIGKLLSSNTKNQLGLKNALKLAGFEFSGIAHRGIDDAVNTAMLLIAYADRIKLSRNQIAQDAAAQKKTHRSKRRPRTVTR